MADTKYGTPYVESELVLAAGQQDWAEVDRLLKEMLDGELATFERTIDHLQDRIWAEQGGR